MKKKIIYHPDYPEPFEDRRQYMEGDSKPLEGTFRSWLPIFAPVITVIGFVVAITIFVQVAKTTNLLATDTVCRVDIIERKDIVTDNRLDNTEKFQKEIKIILDTLVAGQNNTNIRLSRIEDRLPR